MTRDIARGENLRPKQIRRLGALSDERGTSLLEMALLLPILVLLALGVIEIGRYAQFSIVVANAARAGVQYGAQNLATAADSSGIQSAAINDGQQISGLTVSPPANGYSGSYVMCGCSSAGSTPGAACPPTNCNPPNQQVVYVEVDTHGNFNPLFRYPGLPSAIVVNGKAQMRVPQ